MLRRVTLCLFMTFLTLTGFAQEKVLVAAAANVSSVGTPLKAAFEKAYPGMSVEFTFGASGALLTQLQNGAPYQIFMSADKGFAQKLVDAKLTTGPVQIYTVGKLILLTTQPTDFKKGLDILLDPSVKQFANCNPDTAPYGHAALEALTKVGLWEKIKDKLVTAQSISQAFQFTLTSTGVGFVNKSALYTKEGKAYDKEGTYWYEVDQKLYAPLEQGFVVLKSAENSKVTKAFADFLLSKSAQDVFAAYGYGKP